MAIVGGFYKVLTQHYVITGLASVLHKHLQNMLPYLRIPILIMCVLKMFCQGIQSSEVKGNEDVGCQHKSTLGRDYRGTANTTASGLPCKKWLDTLLPSVGDHNHCRNPAGTSSYGTVWCLNDIGPGYCSVPYCPPLKVLDFSLDND